MNCFIEIERNNVTVAEFFSYVRRQCAKKGIPFDLEREDFEKPHNEYSSSYSVKDGKKKCHFSENRTVTRYRSKIASYQTSEGFTRYYHTDELEAYEETEPHCWDSEESAEDAPCKAETFRQFAYDYQAYVLNFDGSCYNEICEFTFDDEKRGHGYYYQCNKDAPEAELVEPDTEALADEEPSFEDSIPFGENATSQISTLPLVQKLLLFPYLMGLQGYY